MYCLTRAHWNYYIIKITEDTVKMLQYHGDILWTQGCQASSPSRTLQQKDSTGGLCWVHGANTSPDRMSASPSVSYTPFSVDVSLCLCQRDQGNSVIKIKLHHVLFRKSYHLIARSRTHNGKASSDLEGLENCFVFLSCYKYFGNIIAFLKFMLKCFCQSKFI